MDAFALDQNTRNGEIYKEYKLNYIHIKKADALFNTLLGEGTSHRASEYLAALIHSQDGKNIREEYRAYGAKEFQERKEWNEGVEYKIAFRKQYFQSHPDFFEEYIKEKLKIASRFFNPTEENIREVCLDMRDIPDKFVKASNYKDTCKNLIDEACKGDMPVYVTVALLSNEKAYVVRLRTQKPHQRDAHYDHNNTCIVDIWFDGEEKKRKVAMILCNIQPHLELLENNEKKDGTGRYHVKSSKLYKYTGNNTKQQKDN